MLTTLLIEAADLHKIVERVGLDHLMDELIERIQHSFAAFDPSITNVPQRTGFNYHSPTGLIEWMPLHDQQDGVMMKIVGYHPSSPQLHGTPTIVSTLSSYETTTGHLTALVDGTFLTSMRTGAASVVASRLLADPESAVVGLVGCGAQAVTQLHALSRVFNLDRVLLFDIDSKAMKSFASRVQTFVDPTLNIVESSLAEISIQSDIVCTATSVEVGDDPVITLNECKPSLHVNAVGSDFPGKTELSKSFLEASLVVPDFSKQASSEGECQQLSPEQYKTSISEIAMSPGRFEYAKSIQTVFDSTGWAIEDAVAMKLVIEWATKLRLGKQVAIENLTSDPRNPYGFLTANLSHVD